MKKKCPAARQIVLELQADLAAEAFSRNPSHRNKIRMQDARVRALRAHRRCI